jgi:hypothetical protein
LDPASRQQEGAILMAIYMSSADDAVEPIDWQFDASDHSSDDLESLRDDLESDVGEVESLIEGLQDWVADAKGRISEIETELEGREASDEPGDDGEPSPTESVGGAVAEVAL